MNNPFKKWIQRERVKNKAEMVVVLDDKNATQNRYYLVAGMPTNLFKPNVVAQFMME